VAVFPGVGRELTNSYRKFLHLDTLSLPKDNRCPEGDKDGAKPWTSCCSQSNKSDQQNCIGTDSQKVAACAIILFFMACRSPGKPLRCWQVRRRFGNNPGGPLVQGLDGNFYGVYALWPEFGVGYDLQDHASRNADNHIPILSSDRLPDGYQPYGALVADARWLSFLRNHRTGRGLQRRHGVTKSPPRHLTTIYSFCLSLHARMETRRSQGWCRPRTEISTGQRRRRNVCLRRCLQDQPQQGALTVVTRFDSYSEGVEPPR